jgi:hypothetical protein
MFFLLVADNKVMHAATTYVPRGIAGLELGMTPEQVGQLFTIKEDIDTFAALYISTGLPEMGKSMLQQNKVLKKKFFQISSGIKQLPDGVTSADVVTSQNVVCEIGFHYNNVSVKKIGLQGIMSPYLAKYGKPTKAKDSVFGLGDHYIWYDDFTYLSIESDNDVVNVFFTDQGIQISNLIQMAEGGDVDAQLQLAKIYYNGERITQDYKESVKWYRKAAEQGRAYAQYRENKPRKCN